MTAAEIARCWVRTAAEPGRWLWPDADHWYGPIDYAVCRELGIPPERVDGALVAEGLR